MFNWFKKKEEKQAVKEEPLYSAQEIASFEASIAQMLTGEGEHTEDASFYEQLGLLYDKVSNSEQAIDMLEKSLSLELSIGDGYKKLMSLYNMKRKEAAIAGDDSQIDYYMGKMDEMRNIAKKVTISGK